MASILPPSFQRLRVRSETPGVLVASRGLTYYLDISYPNNYYSIVAGISGNVHSGFQLHELLIGVSPASDRCLELFFNHRLN